MMISEQNTSTHAAVALAVEVADRQQLHLVELGGEEQADEDQADAGAERVLDDAR